jgi:hypothetical protein
MNNDIRAQMDKIRSDAAEFRLLSNAVDGKREVFAKVAEHLNALVTEVEKTIATDSAGNGRRGESEQLVRGNSEDANASDIAVAPTGPVARPHRITPWLLAAVLGGLVGTFVGTNKPAKEHWPLSALLLNREALPVPKDETKEIVATRLSGDRAERKILVEQLSALAARVDNFEKALDNLKTVPAENADAPNKELAETDPTISGQHRSIRKDDNSTSTHESPAAAPPPVGDSPFIEPPDRVGAIQVPPRRAHLDQSKAALGPSGCAQFRSFDPVSGTYVTFDGRRRQCR